MTNFHSEVRFSIVPEWVIDADISDRAVRVYALLARYADSETLQAFPSRETLAKRAGCHWRSIDRAIDELVQLGAVTKTHRKNGDAYQSNVYTLRRVLPPMSLPTDTGDTRVLTPVSPPTDTAGNLTITTELEPIELQPLNDISANEFDSKFEEWWSVYPNRKGKGAAKTAYKKALKKAGHELLVDSARRYRDDPNREQQFTPYPQKWLNEERWEDSPEPVRHQKLTNAEKAVQLALKYRQEAQREQLALEAESIIDIEEEPNFTGSWLKGVEND